MVQKNIRGKSTPERLQEAWDEMIKDPNDRPGVKEFAKRAKISDSTLSHVYPEWANKIRERRDEKKPRYYSPAIKKKAKEQEVEALDLIDKLRKELITARKELRSAQNKVNDLEKDVKTLKEKATENERLRGIVLKFGDALKKHLDRQKAQNVISELNALIEKRVPELKITDRN